MLTILCAALKYKRAWNCGCRYGKFSMLLVSQLDSHGNIAANITVEEPGACWGKCEPPAGGLVLRLRTPGKRAIVKVLVGGEEWAAFNTSSESMAFTAAQLKDAAFVRKLQEIVVNYRK